MCCTIFLICLSLFIAEDEEYTGADTDRIILFSTEEDLELMANAKE